jgi:hypothetical protein
MSIKPKSKFYSKSRASEEYTTFKISELHTYVTNIINAYIAMPRETTAQEVLPSHMLPTEHIISKVAYTIVCANETMPIESIIGSIASTITGKNKRAQYVIDAHTVAGELVLFASDATNLSDNKLFAITQTLNNKLIVKNLVHNPDLREPTFSALPNVAPTNHHDTLGKYSWQLTETRALDLLNKVPFIVLDLPESEPEMYASMWDRKKDIRDERWIKWNIRKQLIPQYKGETFYFDWDADYRGRMYSSGEMLATL